MSSPTDASPPSGGERWLTGVHLYLLGRQVAEVARGSYEGSSWYNALMPEADNLCRTGRTVLGDAANHLARDVATHAVRQTTGMVGHELGPDEVSRITGDAAAAVRRHLPVKRLDVLPSEARGHINDGVTRVHRILDRRGMDAFGRDARAGILETARRANSRMLWANRVRLQADVADVGLLTEAMARQVASGLPPSAEHDEAVSRMDQMILGLAAERVAAWVPARLDRLAARDGWRTSVTPERRVVQAPSVVPVAVADEHLGLEGNARSRPRVSTVDRGVVNRSAAVAGAAGLAAAGSTLQAGRKALPRAFTTAGVNRGMPAGPACVGSPGAGRGLEGPGDGPGLLA